MVREEGLLSFLEGVDEVFLGGQGKGCFSGKGTRSSSDDVDVGNGDLRRFGQCKLTIMRRFGFHA